MEGTSARSSIPRVAGDEAGPSHQGRDEAGHPGSVVPNASLESSMRNRIVRLEQDNSPYLLDKGKGEYWAHIKQELNHASSERKYNLLLDFENRDLQIRELKHECFSLFNHVLSQHPPLVDQAPYNPQEAFDDFLDQHRGRLDQQQHGLPVWERDALELNWLDIVRKGLQDGGAAYFLLLAKDPTSTIGRSPERVTEKVPAPFQYTNTHAVPWKYDSHIVTHGTSSATPEAEVPVQSFRQATINEPSLSPIANLAGVSGIARSGRCYTSSEVERQRKGSEGSTPGESPGLRRERIMEVVRQREHQHQPISSTEQIGQTNHNATLKQRQLPFRLPDKILDIVFKLASRRTHSIKAGKTCGI
ncbi:hypothetical protein SESBI_24851 [Sesbania bispinosa]|nr:hypothetical protein SESBI_24851 [Sesbania bispinosa]